MDTLHTVMRSLRGETKSQARHLDVFREFLSHLDKINRPAPAKSTAPKTKMRRKPARRSAKR